MIGRYGMINGNLKISMFLSGSNLDFMDVENGLRFIQKRAPSVHEPIDLHLAITYFGSQNLEVVQEMKRCFLFFFGLVLSIMCFVLLEAQTEPVLDTGADDLISDPVITSASAFKEPATPDLNLDKSL